MMRTTYEANNLSRREFLAASAGVVSSISASGQDPKPVEDGGSKSAAARSERRGGANRAARMQIAEALGPTPGPLWRLAKQCGVNYAVGSWRRFGSPDDGGAAEAPWSYQRLERLKKSYEEAGFELAVVECRPPMNKIKLGLPGREHGWLMKPSRRGMLW